MSKLIKTITILSIIISGQAFAAEKDCKETAVVNVNGLVCDFCARALEKVFSKKEEVSSINVNLDDGLVSINMNQGKDIDDELLREMITNSGYDVTGINRKCEKI